MPTALEKYKKQFASLNRSNVRGQLAPHKIILLLAIIDRIEECLMHGEPGKEVVRKSPIAIRPHLEYFFHKEWNIHVHSDVFQPSYENPIIHMQSEPFYHLTPRIDPQTNLPIGCTSERSISALDQAYVGIQLDTDLIELLLEDRPRKELRDLLLGEFQCKEDPVFEHVLDYSFYNYGCTIDKKFHQPIFDVLGGRIERGQRKDIMLRYDGKDFAAQIENVDRKGVQSDTIRCMWKGKAASKLSTYLQQQFASAFAQIKGLHESHVNVLPFNLKRIALFYNKDARVFEMKLKK